MNHMEFDYDVVGVGLGPFNLSLAALLQEHQFTTRNDENHEDAPRALFLEAQSRFNWHPGMILPGTTLQVPFLADLVTMVAPTSRFSFLNYLHQHGRLYHFYFYENFKIFRKEYNLYCQWVSEQLTSIRFGARVLDVRREIAGGSNSDEGYRVFFGDTDGNQTHSVTAKHVVLGYGTRPAVPEFVRAIQGPGVFHTAEFAKHQSQVADARRAIVIGSGQSAGECVLEILRTMPDTDLHWYTRGQGFLPMEYSKLGLEYFSPEYIGYFHNLPEQTRDRIRRGQDLFYKGISSVTIAEIYDTLYERSLDANASRPVLMAGVELCDIRETQSSSENETAHAYRLELRHREQGIAFADSADVVVLGTGYEHILPGFLDNMLPKLATDESGRLQIGRDYRVLMNPDAKPDSAAGGSVHATDNSSGIFVQNGEIHTHGIGAPDLGLGAYRAAVIANALIGQDHYIVRDTNVFQNFGTIPQPVGVPIGG